MSLIKNLKAFTLAEVLITLGIIGVVASLTIPSIIQSYKKQVASAKLKKFYSVMSQAIRMSEIDNGPSGEWAKPVQPEYDGNNEDVSDKIADNNLDYFNNYLKPYMKIVNIEKTDKLNYENTPKKLVINLSDGSCFYFRSGECMDIDFDLNGTKPPNIMGKDIFKFVLCNSTGNTNNISQNQSFSAYCPAVNNRDVALKVCKDSSRRCSCLLQYDNWEFKDDYPYKL